MKEKEHSTSLLLSKEFNVPSFARICKKKVCILQQNILLSQENKKISVKRKTKAVYGTIKRRTG